MERVFSFRCFLLVNTPQLNTQLSSAESESCVTTDGQYVLEYQAAIRVLRPDFYYYQIVAGLSMWAALSDERTGLSFTIAAGARQRSHSLVQVPWDSRSYFTVSDLRLPFSSLLRLARLRWRYSTPLPHGNCQLSCKRGTDHAENTASSVVA
jgi:hypothetical protein